jgi:hypothetical protein
MFDLEIGIAQWRQRLQRAGIRSLATLDELESHLRDDLEAQIRSGTGAEEALELAAWRLGPAQDLRLQFQEAYANPEEKRIAWRYFMIMMTGQALAFASEIRHEFDWPQRLVCLTTLLATALVSYFIWKSLSKFRLAFADSRLALVVMALTAPLGIGCVLLKLGNLAAFHGLDAAQLIETVWWFLVPLHVFNLFVFGRYQRRFKGQQV